MVPDEKEQVLLLQKVHTLTSHDAEYTNMAVNMVTLKYNYVLKDLHCTRTLLRDDWFSKKCTVTSVCLTSVELRVKCPIEIFVSSCKHYNVAFKINWSDRRYSLKFPHSVDSIRFLNTSKQKI